MKSYKDVIKELQTNETSGLTKQQVEEKQQQFGPNALQEKKKTPLIIKFLAEFKDFMVIILLIAAVVSVIVGVDALLAVPIATPLVIFEKYTFHKLDILPVVVIFKFVAKYAYPVAISNTATSIATIIVVFLLLYIPFSSVIIYSIYR